MLENFKSIYFIKILFSFLDDGRKLKLIKYNKYFQNMIEINLINYKRYSGKYIIFESKEKVKEYKYYYSQEDYLIYEGEYLKGSRNGKGKEYDYYGNIIFEGEYLNGKRNGKGKEYEDKFLVFEGEYLNGGKWNGKGYDENKNIIYQIINGKGFIKKYLIGPLVLLREHNLNGNFPKTVKYYDLLFEGEYLNGKKNGKVKEYDENNNLIFEGEYLNGKKWNGTGYDNENNITYELKNGNGFIHEYDYDNKIIYEGNILYGKKIGKGKEYDLYENLHFEGD